MNQPVKPRTRDEQIEYNLKQAAATLAIEGLFVTEQETAQVRAYLKGEISEADVLANIKKRHGLTV